MDLWGSLVKSDYRPQRDIVAQVVRTTAGNVVLIIGRELPTGGWEKTGHVVLTPAEAADLSDTLAGASR